MSSRACGIAISVLSQQVLTVANKMKRDEQRSALTVFVKRTLQQRRVEQGAQLLKILLFARIGPTGPLFQIKTQGAMQQPDGIRIQIELERWRRIGHALIVATEAIDERSKWGVVQTY